MFGRMRKGLGMQLVVWSRYVVLTGAATLGMFACVHKGDTTDSNATDPQPTEAQLWAIADDMATHVPAAALPGDNGDLGGSDGGAVASTDDGGSAPPDATEVGTGTPPAVPPGWFTVAATACGLTVNMPGDVKEDDKTGDAAHQFRFPIPGSTDGFYSLSCTDFPNGTSNAPGWLDAARDKLDGNGGKLTSEKPLTLAGNPGREVHVDLPGGGKEIARAFLLKNKSIVAIVGGAPNAIKDSDVTSFLDSIRLTQ